MGINNLEDFEPLEIADDANGTTASMTQIRRPKQQQRITLLTVFVALGAIFLVTVALLNLDAFPKRRKQPKQPMASALTPDKLDQNVVVNEQTENLRGSVDIVKEEPAGGKTFRMELSGLKEGQTGAVIFQTRPDWAPIGVEHFHKLVESNFYDECRFFRVVDNFMVQFGINGDPEIQKKWRGEVLKDDPVEHTNERGTITFATSGKDSRTVQLFINTNDKGNAFLDKQGFSPFAEVLSGMEFVDIIENKYKEKPDQGKIQNRGNAYLNEEFPDLSYISTVREEL